ncbi:MAG TPA: protease complex subunit PrcB family protein [Balneolaceae bacterium]
MNFKSLLCIGITLLIMIGCQNILNEKGSKDFFENATKVNFKPLEQGFYGNIAEQNLVIKNERAFEDFWSSLHSNQKPLPDIPKVDFNTDMVLASVMDTKPTGGYVVEIAQVGVLDGRIGVKVKNRNPGKNCGTTAALTTPYHIIRMDKSKMPVEFFEEEITVDCGE